MAHRVILHNKHMMKKRQHKIQMCICSIKHITEISDLDRKKSSNLDLVKNLFTWKQV